MQEMRFPPVKLPEAAERLRQEVREFLAAELAAGTFEPSCDSWLSGFDPAFSRKLGERGWIGMTWPKKYGGHERSGLERFVVTEELLAVGAPVTAHWIGDRQSGPLILRYGTEGQRETILPKVARGEVYFAIGMSEPDAGSDLASIKTTARKVEGGYRVTGTKVWTSHAHLAHYFILLCRTEPAGEDRHAGISQFLFPLQGVEGVTIRPIPLLTGAHHFNEVVLDDAFVPEDALVGRPGEGWKQVMAELAYERSGPERFLSNYPLVAELVRVAGENPDSRLAVSIGQLVARLWTLHRMSLAVAGMLDAGQSPGLEAALVKDLGTRFEQQCSEVIRLLVDAEPSLSSDSRIEVLLAEGILHGPGFTLRGGTSEILRGIVARGLGVR